jgi:hypothetical protein
MNGTVHIITIFHVDIAVVYVRTNNVIRCIGTFVAAEPRAVKPTTPLSLLINHLHGAILDRVQRKIHLTLLLYFSI